MREPRTLGDVADLVRSKNAGPFWMTLDIFFATDAEYEGVASPGVLERREVAELYRVPPDDVRIFHLPSLRAIKISFPRPVTQGSFSDRDIHAGQQYIPLSELPVQPHGQ
jgi:Domain of unknown function (DUF4387)